ncbi:MAG TPA: cytidine deaminase [Gemmata sp.]|jgi:cytidine deaminase|nr:cytidine deaminase [Gemmata sp.]
MENPNRREVMGIAVAASIAVATNNMAEAEGPKLQSNKETDMSEPDKKTLEDMAKRAKIVSEKAHCPYSKFRVGAVVLTDDGQMFEGCNVENASYGLTICAERNAVFQMVARAKQKIAAIVIYTPTPKPSAPCGACRQVINEFGPDALVMSVCDGPDVLKKKLSELLPDAFGPSNLGK